MWQPGNAPSYFQPCDDYKDHVVAGFFVFIFQLTVIYMRMMNKIGEYIVRRALKHSSIGIVPKFLHL